MHAIPEMDHLTFETFVKAFGFAFKLMEGFMVSVILMSNNNDR